MPFKPQISAVLRRHCTPTGRRLGGHVPQAARAAAPTLPAPSVRCLATTAARSWRPSAPRRAANITYTSERYPSLQRDPRFARVTPEHVAFFKQALGAENAVIDAVTDPAAQDDVEPFNSDWMRKFRGHGQLVLRPGSTAEVSTILQYCNAQRLAVVPQGGNTGLVGGSVPVFDEIVLSLGRMQQIRSFDAASGVLVADAGVVLEAADTYLAERGHLFPLDLGAKGSCHIGGNVSTNAGGLRLLRYGSLHGTVLGLEVVLPDGTVVNDLCTLRKNNTGYDLKQLFVGAEGTLGVVTAVAVQCPPRPAAVNVAFLGLSSYAHAQKAFRQAKAQLSEILSAFELMDAGSQQIVRTVRPDARRPLEGDHAFYCLVETSGSQAEHDTAKLEAFLEDVLGEGIVDDGVVAQDATQAAALWAWREGITECLGHLGGVYKYDLSIPQAALYQLVEDTQARLDAAGVLSATDDAAPAAHVVGYGHMGDCNLHLNVAVRRYDPRVEQALEPFVYEWVQSRQGSISAEHGLGLAKKKYIGYSRDDTAIGLMKQIKNMFDPNGIMNPYKYI
ncbi:actin interacting protein 2 [Niveomyces insectorum RCEF 264]|uniref:D-lactate dehydrogenase (cytochrome) n=1 Tax=Niveomyces insectorum RCEF 264 TaxID=1081102 RepID=A0A162MMW0_9HYPO|nr:actin interacting protein 2 [Niveomyces insectorum RCEF 264]